MCRALVLLAASGSAFVVPPRQLARRQTSSDVTAASRPERAPAPASWQNESVGGVRVERLVALAGVGALSYSTYVLGSEALDATMVAQLGISRSKSVAAFGPFVTLLGLVYSTLLSNIYSFYLSRQSKILDDLFAETYAVRDLYEVGMTVDASSTANEALRTHALRLRATGFQPSADDGQRALRDLFAAAAEFERAAAIEAPELGKYFSAAYQRAAEARVARAAALASRLPRIELISFKAISTIVLASFLLVDLGSPRFEAILFSVLACSFFLLESFINDLEDPFGGSWTVDAAREACDDAD
mmetsp:Transcript_9013/g.28175  ORF Transcript_9013/g.28175 Transcript_9013/m.28175 type:complete len:302 (-) Transcript_9013:54-959(-)